MTLAELRFRHARDGSTSNLWVEVSSFGSHGAIGPHGVSAARGFPAGTIDANGWLRAADGIAAYLINPAEVESGDYQLSVKCSALTISTVTFKPIAEGGVIDVNALVRNGKARLVMPEEQRELEDALRESAAQRDQIRQVLLDIEQDQAAHNQQQQANNEASAQAVQTIISALAIQGTVPTDAALTGKPAGTYVQASSGELLTWSGGGITNRQPMLPTTQTSVARVPDIAALRAYAKGATTITVDDVMRGGTFVCALASVAGAVNNGTRFAHSNPLYVWQRLSSSDEVRVDWFIDPAFSHAQQIQAAIDATPTNGTLIGGRKATANGGVNYYTLTPWARPDGRNDVILTINRPIHLAWRGNEYGGFLAPSGVPLNVDILEISAAGGDGTGTLYGYRFDDLAIIPLNSTPVGRHVVNVVAAPTHNLADVTFSGGQLVTYNVAGRALHMENSGANGVFSFRLRDLKTRGGVRLHKLGDSCEIIGGTHGGDVLVFDISFLTPADPTEASSEFVMARVNINTKAQAIQITDASTFTLANLNIESRNRGEGQTAFEQPLVYLVNCGTVYNANVGPSTRAYSGSLVSACKILPASGATYNTTSAQYGVLVENSRNITFQGGAYGTAQLLNAQNEQVASGYALRFAGSADCVVDGVDIQTTPNCLGVDIDGGSKNIAVRRVSQNPASMAGVQLVRDAGQGTMGVLRPVPLSAGYEAKPGTAGVRMIKREDGVVTLFGALQPVGGTATIPAYTTLADLPAGFRPIEGVSAPLSIVRGQYYPGQGDRGKTDTVICDIVASDQGAAAGRWRINPLPSSYDESIPDVRQISAHLSWYAPPAP